MKRWDDSFPPLNLYNYSLSWKWYDQYTIEDELKYHNKEIYVNSKIKT